MIDELRQEMLAEQAQRLARLELRNRIHMIGLLIWGTLLLGWMIYCFVKLMIMANRQEPFLLPVGSAEQRLIFRRNIW